jgi:hypothetical protein
MRQLTILSTLFFAISCSQPDTRYITGLEGKPLPNFSVLLSDSVTYLSSKNIPEGQPIVLFCFGPHCAYSRAQMEEIVSNISSIKDIRFYAITPWSFGEMKDFSHDYSLNKYPNIVSAHDTANFLGSYFKMKGVPFTLIYDKNKKLKGSFLGKTSYKEIKRIAEG